MNDPIKAALDAAVNAHTVDAWTLEDEHRAWLTQNMAAAIAAFLRALPEGASYPTGDGDLRASAGPMPALAAAVERAAKDGAE